MRLRYYYRNFYLTIIIVLVAFILYNSKIMAEENIRPDYVAGLFYQKNPAELKSFIQNLINKAELKNCDKDICAIIVPHAGYVYSAFVAAEAYKALIGKHYDAAIVLAPSHHEGFHGAAIFPGDFYMTPLGKIKVDKDLAALIAKAGSSSVNFSMAGHGRVKGEAEHSLEVQLPLLQEVQPDLPIVPIVVGYQNLDIADDLMKSLYNAIKVSNKKVLIIASSDLSHYHSKKEAEKLDGALMAAVNDFDCFKIGLNCLHDKWEACGAVPIVSAMMTAELLGAGKAEILKYACSADSPYEKSSTSQVVGYMSVMIYKDSTQKSFLPDFSVEEQKLMQEIAKTGIQNSALGLKQSITNIEITNNLKLNLPVFVTIQKHGNLRACMGYLFASSYLANEILISSEMAAKDDYRFGPVRREEFDSLTYEITVLSRMKRIIDTDEIEVGKHGLYIRLGSYSGLLLPQVATEYHWNRQEFLENVCQKAGLGKNEYLNPKSQIFIFEGKIIK